MFSGRRGAALIAVILLHVLMVWAFVSGLAGKLVQKIIPPVEIAQIDKPKDIDKPPPPPPKLEEVKPFVPPPEFVDIQAPQQETTAITQTTQVQTPVAPIVQAAPPVHSISAPKYDSKHPFHIGPDYYPDASMRAGEEGNCILMMRVSATGQILDATVQTSTGFPRLDEACLKGVKGQRMGPAMEDGKPIEGTFPFKIIWKLTGK
jgi:periplasmic protein TonB